METFGVESAQICSYLSSRDNSVQFYTNNFLDFQVFIITF